MKKHYLAVIGPTASGKSSLAMRLAQDLNGELINCDSVQIYRGFDIGSAKPDADDLQRVPHHLIDIKDAHEPYDARIFAHDAQQAIEDVRSRNRLPILVGGTGLYLKALWQEGFHDLPKSEELRAELKSLGPEELRKKLMELDPKRAEEIHGNDRFRLQRAVEVASLLGHSVKDLPPPSSRRDQAFVLYLSVERKILQERIALRTQAMLKNGLIEEVQSLLQKGVDPEIKPMQSIGYREVAAYLQEQKPSEELEESIIIATRQYAKRQETLFRKIERDFVWTGDDDYPFLLQRIKASF